MFGGLWQFRGFRGVGTRDWAARVSLRGERGCASEPVAREGVPVEGSRGSGSESGGAESSDSAEDNCPYPSTWDVNAGVR